MRDFLDESVGRTGHGNGEGVFITLVSLCECLQNRLAVDEVMQDGGSAYVMSPTL